MSNNNCIFCGTPILGDEPKERIHVYRWVKNTRGGLKKERKTLELPTCNSCSKKIHPFHNKLTTIAAYVSALAPLCVLFSLIHKNTFVLSPIGGIITFVFAGAFSYGIIFFLFSLALMICDDAFQASLNVKPYCNLPVIRSLINYGYLNDTGVYPTPTDMDVKSSLQFKDIKEEIKTKYSCDIS